MTGAASRRRGHDDRAWNVVGLDLSIAATGACYVDERFVKPTTETWKLAASMGDQRLREIVFRVGDRCPDDTDLAVIEDLPTHAHGAGITGMVHGAVRAALMDFGIPYALVTPATLKKFATGKGNADKTAMAMAAYKRAGVEFADDNQCDAWWLYAAGMQHLGEPLFDLPAAQVDALSKVSWPDVAGLRQGATP